MIIQNSLAQFRMSKQAIDQPQNTPQENKLWVMNKEACRLSYNAGHQLSLSW